MDEVFFVVNTEHEDDLEYLDQIVNGTEGYKKHVTENDDDGWTGKWELVERGNIYIKIDGKSRSVIGTLWHETFCREEISCIQIEIRFTGCSPLLRLALPTSSRMLNLNGFDLVV